jgi:hypothetical protein
MVVDCVHFKVTYLSHEIIVIPIGYLKTSMAAGGAFRRQGSRRVPRRIRRKRIWLDRMRRIQTQAVARIGEFIIRRILGPGAGSVTGADCITARQADPFRFGWAQRVA